MPLFSTPLLHRNRRTARRSAGAPRGFTLTEAMLAVVIVGVGTLGMMTLLASGSMANADAAELTTGLTLANNIHELMQTSSTFGFAESATATTWGMESETGATADDIDDFDGYTFSPAVDSRRQAISYLSGWTQSIAVESVNPANLSSIISHTGKTPDQRPCSKI